MQQPAHSKSRGAHASDADSALDQAIERWCQVVRWRRTGYGAHAGTTAWGGRRGVAGEFAGYRPYEPGDDLRSLDLRVYRRLRERAVRVTQEDSALPVTIAVDRSASMDDPARVDSVVALTAFFSALTHRQRDSLRLFGFDDRSAFPIPQPNRLRSGALREALYHAPPAHEPLDDRSMSNPAQPLPRTAVTDGLFTNGFRQIPPDPHGRGLILVISDAFGLTDVKGATRALSRIGVPWWISPLTPTERRPETSDGSVELRSREAESPWIGIISASLVSRYRAELRRFHQALDRELGRWGGGFTRYSTERSLESFVVECRRHGRWVQ